MNIIRKTSLIKSIFLLAFFTLLLSFNNFASAVVLDNDTAKKDQPNSANSATKEDDNKQHYVPNEIIVKFKSEIAGFWSQTKMKN